MFFFLILRTYWCWKVWSKHKTIWEMNFTSEVCIHCTERHLNNSSLFIRKKVYLNWVFVSLNLPGLGNKIMPTFVSKSLLRQRYLKKAKYFQAWTWLLQVSILLFFSRIPGSEKNLALGQRPRNYSSCCSCSCSYFFHLNHFLFKRNLSEKILPQRESNQGPSAPQQSALSTKLQKYCYYNEGKLPI